MTAAEVVLDLVVPAHDEERDLEACVEGLLPVVRALAFPVRVTLVDSGSTDGTWALAERLAEVHPEVAARRVALPGRGLALRRAWEQSDAPLLGYTDVDLSGDPASLGPMLERIRAGEADIVVGSRLAAGAVVTRGLKREVLSRVYGELLQWSSAPPFLDAQCGLKVLRSEVRDAVLDEVVDDAWFFDTELLLRAWRAGWRIEEQPVRWVERRRTTVQLPGTVLGDLAGLVRLSRRPPPRRIGVAGSDVEDDRPAGRAVARREVVVAAAVAAAGVGATLPSRRLRRSALGVAAAVPVVSAGGRPRPARGSTPVLHGVEVAGVVALAAVVRRSGGPRWLRALPAVVSAMKLASRLAVLRRWDGKAPGGVGDRAGGRPPGDPVRGAPGGGRRAVG